MSCESKPAMGKGVKFAQYMADQTPRFENQVLSRKTKVIRADKRKQKRKFY